MCPDRIWKNSKYKMMDSAIWGGGFGAAIIVWHLVFKHLISRLFTLPSGSWHFNPFPRWTWSGDFWITGRDPLMNFESLKWWVNKNKFSVNVTFGSQPKSHFGFVFEKHIFEVPITHLNLYYENLLEKSSLRTNIRKYVSLSRNTRNYIHCE